MAAMAHRMVCLRHGRALRGQIMRIIYKGLESVIRLSCLKKTFVIGATHSGAPE
jgi:hypothetical protein